MVCGIYLNEKIYKYAGFENFILTYFKLKHYTYVLYWIRWCTCSKPYPTFPISFYN